MRIFFSCKKCSTERLLSNHLCRVDTFHQKTTRISLKTVVLMLPALHCHTLDAKFGLPCFILMRYLPDWHRKSGGWKEQLEQSSRSISNESPHTTKCWRHSVLFESKTPASCAHLFIMHATGLTRTKRNALQRAQFNRALLNCPYTPNRHTLLQLRTAVFFLAFLKNALNEPSTRATMCPI